MTGTALELLSATSVLLSTFAANPAPRPSMPSDALPVPIMRQAHPYSCGAAVLLSILYYWQAHDGGEASLYRDIATTPEKGTDPEGIVRGARGHGLEAALKEKASFDDLRKALGRGETVILDFQAWPDELVGSTATWRGRWEDGHYAVLVGMDETYVYLMDPSVGGGYTYIPRVEFLERWHDYEDRPGGARRYERLAVFIRGRKPVPSFPGPLVPTL